MAIALAAFSFGGVSLADDVAQIVGWQWYATLQAAVNATSSGDVVRLLSNITNEHVSISSKNLTLDLDWHMINPSTAWTIIDIKGGSIVTIMGTWTIQNNISWDHLTLAAHDAGTKVTILNWNYYSVSTWNTALIFVYDGAIITIKGWNYTWTKAAPGGKDWKVFYAWASQNQSWYENRYWTLIVEWGSFDWRISNSNWWHYVVRGWTFTKNEVVYYNNSVVPCINTNTTISFAEAWFLDEWYVITQNWEQWIVSYDPVATVWEKWYSTFTWAVEQAVAWDTVRLLKPITLTETVTIDKNLTLDLNNQKITANFAGNSQAINIAWWIVTVKNWDIEWTQRALTVSSGKWIIESGIYKTTIKWQVMNAMGSNSELTILDGTFNWQETAVMAFDWATVTIEWWTFTTVDNFVIWTNGTSWRWNNNITINWWIFNWNITSAWYIACWIYAANNDTIIINNWTFNVTNWAWIVVRWWTITIGKNVVFNVDGSSQWKVWDSAIQVPAWKEVVMDIRANYPWNQPFKIINNLTWTYLITSTDAYTVSIKDGENFVKLEMDRDATSNSAKITQPASPSNGCNIFNWRYNNWSAFDFSSVVSSDLALTANWTSKSCGWSSSSSRPSNNTSNNTSSNTWNNKTGTNNTWTNNTWVNNTWTVNTWTVDTWTNNNEETVTPADPQAIQENGYTKEFNDAYEFAFANGITTMKNIEEAAMEDWLTRIAMAKMLSQYAINVLKKTPDTSKECKFTDVSEELDAQYDHGVTLACQLGIMWVWITEFRPDDLVVRAEFGTALSRLLFGLPDGEEAYYTTHLAKLKEAWIISNDDPSLEELRWYVMLMLMRSAK